jgi:hypothetical protein
MFVYDEWHWLGERSKCSVWSLILIRNVSITTLYLYSLLICRIFLFHLLLWSLADVDQQKNVQIANVLDEVVLSVCLGGGALCRPTVFFVSFIYSRYRFFLSRMSRSYTSPPQAPPWRVAGLLCFTDSSLQVKRRCPAFIPRTVRFTSMINRVALLLEMTVFGDVVSRHPDDRH